MKKIDEQVWFITGITSGLGRALAEAVLNRGGKVIGTTRSGRTDLTAPDNKLHVLALEVTDPSQTRRVVEQAHALRGSLDVVVNNAGYGCLAPLRKPPPKKPNTSSRSTSSARGASSKRRCHCCGRRVTGTSSTSPR